MFYMRMATGKNEKRRQLRNGILIFNYTQHFAYLKVYTHFKTLALIGPRNSVTEISIGEKEK